MMVNVKYFGSEWAFDSLPEAEDFATKLVKNNINDYNFSATVKFVDIDDIKKVITYERCDYDDAKDDGTADCCADEKAAEPGETVQKDRMHGQDAEKSGEGTSFEGCPCVQ